MSKASLGWQIILIVAGHPMPGDCWLSPTTAGFWMRCVTKPGRCMTASWNRLKAGMPPTSSNGLNETGWQLQPKRSEEHTSELQSRGELVCRLLLEKKMQREITAHIVL